MLKLTSDVLHGFGSRNKSKVCCLFTSPAYTLRITALVQEEDAISLRHLRQGEQNHLVPEGQDDLLSREENPDAKGASVLS